jgi:hypothetical protein
MPGGGTREGSRRLLGIIVGAVAAALLLAAPAAANTYRPTRFGDPSPGACKPNDCSLREAVRAANSHTGADTIVLRQGHYNLKIPGLDEESAAMGDLDVTGSLTVVKRSGDATPVIDGNDVDRIFDVRVGSAALALNGLRLRDGNPGPGSGGAIRVFASGTAGLRIANSALVSNNATFGAGIYSLNRVAIVDSTLADNPGGAVYAATAHKKLEVSGSELTGNTASYVAGVFGNGPVIAEHSTFTGNDAGATGSGGGIYASQPGDKVEISDSTFTGNKSGYVGAVYANGPVTVARSTFRNNDSTISGSGGGLYASQPNANVQISRTSFIGNKSGYVGGAYANGATSVANSVFRNNDSTTQRIGRRPLRQPAAGEGGHLGQHLHR